MTLLGFIGKRHYKRANQTSCDLQTQSSIVRVVSEYEVEEGAAYKTHQDLRVIPTHSPVLVTGTLAPRKGDPPIGDHPHATVPLKPNTRSWYLKLRTIRCLNHFDKSIIVSKDAVWPPHQRHLQMRFDPKLFQRLHLRLRSLISDNVPSVNQLIIAVCSTYPVEEGLSELECKGYIMRWPIRREEKTRERC